MKEKKEITYGVRAYNPGKPVRHVDGYESAEQAIETRDHFRSKKVWEQVEAVMIETTVKETVV